MGPASTASPTSESAARRRRAKRQRPPRRRKHHSRQARRRLHRKAPRPAPLQRARIRSPGLTSRQAHSPPESLRSRRTPVLPRPARMWLRHLTSKRKPCPRAGPDEFAATSRDGGCPVRLLHQPYPEPGPSSHACSCYTEHNSGGISDTLERSHGHGTRPANSGPASGRLSGSFHITGFRVRKRARARRHPRIRRAPGPCKRTPLPAQPQRARARRHPREQTNQEPCKRMLRPARPQRARA